MTLRSIYTVLIFLSGFFHSASSYSQSDFNAQVKKMSDTLAARIARTGKIRIAISNFTDMQGNTTELGKYISEAFSVELSNSNLELVDRSRINELLKELKMTEEKLTEPSNALKLGAMAGIQYIITGTTTPLDNTVEITVKALDIQKGISIAGQRGSLSRTDAINNLMRSNVNSNDNVAANVNMGKTVDASGKSPMDVLFEASVSSLRPVDCSSISIADGRTKLYAGQICFENQTGLNLRFSAAYRGAQGKYHYEKDEHIILPNARRNCTGQVVVNWDHTESNSIEVSFLFETTDLQRNKSGYFKVSVEKCKVKSFVLTKDNLILQ